MPVLVSPARWPGVVRRHRLAFSACVLFLLLAAAYAGSIDIRATRGAVITADEPFYLLTTQSLLQDGDLDLRQQYDRKSYTSFFDHPDGLWRQSGPLESGEVLSPHNPGLSVLLIPGFALGGLTGSQVQMLLLAALAFTLSYLLAASITGSLLWSWLATAAVGLSASAFIFATEIYPEIPAALTLAASLLILQRTQRPRWRHALAIAALLTGMMWLGVKYAPLAAVIACWTMWRSAPDARWTLLGIGGLSAVAYAWFHIHTFGGLTPYTVGAVYEGDSTLSIFGQHVEFSRCSYRLWGLFIDRNFGVGRWAPILLATVPALPLLWKGHLERVILAVIVLQLLIATFVAITMMGYWFPGRTLMTVFPLLPAALALLLVRLPNRGKAVLGLLAGYSLALTGLLAAAGHAREMVIAVDPFEMRSPVFQAIAPLFPDYTFWDTHTWVATGLWLLVLTTATASVVRSSLPTRTARDSSEATPGSWLPAHVESAGPSPQSG